MIGTSGVRRGAPQIACSTAFSGRSAGPSGDVDAAGIWISNLWPKSNFFDIGVEKSISAKKIDFFSIFLAEKNKLFIFVSGQKKSLQACTATFISHSLAICGTLVIPGLLAIFRTLAYSWQLAVPVTLAFPRTMTFAGSLAIPRALAISGTLANLGTLAAPFNVLTHAAAEGLLWCLPFFFLLLLCRKSYAQ